MVTVDFNYVIHVSEMFGEEGHDSLEKVISYNAELIENPHMGWFFTWCNRRVEKQFPARKLNRVLFHLSN